MEYTFCADLQVHLLETVTCMSCTVRTTQASSRQCVLPSAVYRVANPRLWGAYANRCAEIAKDLGTGECQKNAETHDESINVSFGFMTELQVSPV